ncbi:hypothetical protein LAZ67_16002695 [Cordylochernes scorpioides]|uniref:TIL domain-containing protein n=1 Tax=Cordylochernes scorpioides TaxID=51811 RepID=A0ABY6LEB9_9ARAC|nr:hypothetical protein LAZ67_16002695 [Cordylochernes scorpioides]
MCVFISEVSCRRPNEQYFTCGSACQHNCSNYNEKIICSERCVFGCFCFEGYVRESDDNSFCLKKQNCSRQETSL